MNHHFQNNHTGLLDVQKEELRHIKSCITRLLWNTSIMLLRRKKVDYDYINNQSLRLEKFVDKFNKNQIERIQNNESKIRLSILFYGYLENSLKISEQIKKLLNIFKDSFNT